MTTAWSNGERSPRHNTPSVIGASAGSAVRVAAQRRVYKDEKLTKLLKVEPLNDPAFYEEFFVRLSKSVYLEGQKT